ncbi:hypothetical protein ACHHYP_08030 [Achlya hypogyna]|uniref:G-protein coupled receptors family 1 profile domain-containing protein n=1 Tax=Achlya hypogyna TaxID=1202772 RepID=A0A1V9YPX3_ACHHY|nr:hypothetical protein ACHHYP_08030 [Achlya hypogyna]
MDMDLFDTVDYAASGILLGLALLVLIGLGLKHRKAVLRTPSLYVTASMFLNMMLWSLFSIIFMVVEESSSPEPGNATIRRYRRSCMHVQQIGLPVASNAFLLALDFWVLVASFELYTMIAYHHLLASQTRRHRIRIVKGYTKVVYGLTLMYVAVIFFTSLSPASTNSLYCWLVSTTVVFNAVAAALAGGSLLCVYMNLRSSVNRWPVAKQGSIRRVQWFILFVSALFLFFCIPFLIKRMSWTFRQATNTLGRRYNQTRSANATSSRHRASHWRYIFHIINLLLTCCLGALLSLDWFKAAYPKADEVPSEDQILPPTPVHLLSPRHFDDDEGESPTDEGLTRRRLE